MNASTEQTQTATDGTILSTEQMEELLKSRLGITRSKAEGYLTLDGADFIGGIGPDYIMFAFDGEQCDEYPSNYQTEGGFLQAVDYQIRFAFANEGAPLLIDPNHVIGKDVPSYT